MMKKEHLKTSLIVPLLMFVAFVIKQYYGIEIPQEVMDGLAETIATFILIGGTIYGIFKNHNDPNDPSDENKTPE